MKVEQEFEKDLIEILLSLLEKDLKTFLEISIQTFNLKGLKEILKIIKTESLTDEMQQAIYFIKLNVAIDCRRIKQAHRRIINYVLKYIVSFLFFWYFFWLVIFISIRKCRWSFANRNT